MITRFASAAALLAATSLGLPSPAAARLPGAFANAPAAWRGEAASADHYRRWHRDRVDAGDVIAGVAAIGVIAAVASAISKDERERRDRRTEGYPHPERPYNYRRPATPSYQDSRGIDRAVDVCTREIERGGSVNSVDSVARSGTGWRVAGRLRDGAPFSCVVGDDGRIEELGGARVGTAAVRQWDDDRYAAARQAQDGVAAPAYPGGPLPGDADNPAPVDDDES